MERIMNGSDVEIFEGKTFSGLLKDICVLSNNKKLEIDAIVQKLLPMIKDAADAMNIAPVLQKFIDVGVKNDDQLVKVATIVQKIITVENQSNAGDLENILSDKEKEQLRESAVEALNGSKEISADLITIKSALEK